MLARTFNHELGKNTKELKLIEDELAARFNACCIAEQKALKQMYQDALYMGLKPPTKWQRLKYKLADIKQRCKDIWTIISGGGGDIHENCGD